MDRAVCGGPGPGLRIAGRCGPTAEAISEAELARDLVYHAGLLSHAAMKRADEPALLEHCQKVGQANRYRVHGRWFDVDELLVCGTDDPVVEAEISKRKAAQDKKHAVWK